MNQLNHPAQYKTRVKTSKPLTMTEHELLEKSQSPDASPSTRGHVMRELAQRELARRSLLHFTQRLTPRYQAGWVHADICQRLERFAQDVKDGKSPRLMLLMPPRHGKSELASRNFPAWYLGHNPDHEFIACSYNVSLAMTFSRRVKETIHDPSYVGVFPTVRLNPNNQSAEEWSLAGRRGGYVAAGIGGGITGRGAHVLVIDDPVKNAEEADSADNREKIWSWFTSTAYTRLAPGGGVLIIQTCWHDDDLAGRIQAQMAQDPEADRYEIVKYPAIATADEFLDYDTGLIVEDEEPGRSRILRRKGEALHPERYPLPKLQQIKRTLPSRFWAALYQQDPVPDDGGFFQKEQFGRAPVPVISECNALIAWDFAITERQTSDYTVGTVVLQDHADVLHVVDQIRFRTGDAQRIVEAMLALYTKWSGAKNITVGAEDGQILRAMNSVLRRQMRETRTYMPITALRPLTDKLARARPLQARMQQGLVQFAHDVPFFEPLQREMLRFPAAAHDDQVDSLAWAAQLATESAPPARPKIKGHKSWRDKINGMTRMSGSHMAA